MSKSKNKDHHLTIRNGVYYVIGRRKVNGKSQRLSRSTGIRVGDPSPGAARADARKMRDAMLREWRNERTDILDQTRLRDSSARLSEVCDAYLKIVQRHGKPQMRTARRNVGALRTMVRCVTGREVEDCSVNALNRQFVVDYADKRLAGCEDVQSTQISVNSSLRQARSVFKRSVLGELPARLTPGDVTGFLTQFACVDPMTEQARDLQPPSDAEMRPLVEASSVLQGSELWPMWLLNFYLGMRARECRFCRWDWFGPDQFGRMSVHIKRYPAQGFRPKGRSRVVPLADDVWRMLGECRGEGEFVLPGSARNRRRITQYRYNDWIRSLGWAREKKSHAVRSYRLECWRRAFGDQVAQDWGGHVSGRTTKDHYTSNVHDLDPLGVDA